MTSSQSLLRRAVSGVLVVVVVLTSFATTQPAAAAEAPVWSSSDGIEIITTTAVAVAPAPDGGAWTVDANGVVANHGGLLHYGDLSGIDVAAPIVDIAATETGAGYLLVAADGGVFAFGDARFYGSAAHLPLASPVVGVVLRPGGYWLAAADGGVFNFGNVAFYGSAGAIDLAADIIGIEATNDMGYRLVAADGGVFVFGSADFHGSLGNVQLTNGVVALASTSSGYWVATEDGTMHGFGQVGTEALGLSAGRGHLIDVGAFDDGTYVAVFSDVIMTEAERFVAGLSPERIATWDALAWCESTGRWDINTGNGYYGGIQFAPSSWRAVGGERLPHQASREEQIYRGELLLAIQGWGAWPGCTRKLGLR